MTFNNLVCMRKSLATIALLSQAIPIPCAVAFCNKSGRSWRSSDAADLWCGPLHSRQASQQEEYLGTQSHSNVGVSGLAEKT